MKRLDTLHPLSSSFLHIDIKVGSSSDKLKHFTKRLGKIFIEPTYCTYEHVSQGNWTIHAHVMRLSACYPREPFLTTLFPSQNQNCFTMDAFSLQHFLSKRNLMIKSHANVSGLSEN